MCYTFVSITYERVIHL